jgi:hypothetical protein
MVVALTDRPEVRRTFEDQAVAEMRERDVRAISSHPLIRRLGTALRQELVAAGEANGVDVVLVSRVVGLSPSGELTLPGAAGSADVAALQPFYDAAHELLMDAPADDQEVVVTAAYLLGSQQLVWGGVSWTFELDDWRSAVGGLTEMLAENVGQALAQVQAR